MKVKTITCLVTLGTMTTVSKCVWPWDAEVLKEKFAGQCEFHEEGEAELAELPDAGSEFSRLQDAHGVDEETKVSHVESTFGRGKAGLKELEKCIEGSKVKAKPGPKKSTQKPSTKVESKTEKDPLE